jgi:hypothetical protein
MKNLLLATIFVLTSIFAFSQCTTISDGTYGNSQTSAYIPLYGGDNNSWSSTIYYVADVGSAKNISSIGWYVDAFQSGYSQSGPYTFSNVKIYFAYITNTTKSWTGSNNIGGTNRLIGNNVTYGITNWTKVYDGVITFNASNVWKYITLDSQFSYNGTSNLIVHVENLSSSSPSGYPIFHYTNIVPSTNKAVKNGYDIWSNTIPNVATTVSYKRQDTQFCEPVSLPIELLFFKGVADERENILEWSSASESNNDFYTVYYMNNKDLIWQDGVRVAGAGTSSIVHNYHVTIPYYYQGINYYMLEQTDTDGKHKTYVDLIVSIDNTSKATKIVSRITNSLGQDIDDSYKGIIFINFSDGSTIIQYRE